MTERFAIECLISDLTAAAEHAKAAGLGLHFKSEIAHLLATAEHNREEMIAKESQRASVE